MEIKRTNSLQIEGPEVGHNHSDTIIEKPVGQSEFGLSTLFASRSRMPKFMQQTLRGEKFDGSAKDPGEADMKKSKLGSAIRSKFKKRNVKNCQICDNVLKKDGVFMCDCEHKFNFCESCLHHYVIYKVKIFEEVRCPREECPAILDINTEFFKQLPADVQRAYRRFQQFSANANNPNVKLCPKENCQGLIHTTVENVMVCDKCESEFCAKCLLARHEGDCDKHEVMFFQSNLHYRQCTKCKFIIEKNQGCNHMTCRCGYQFCYVCGAVWEQAHYGNHDENGNLIVVQNGSAQAAAAPNANNEDPCCDCSCCNECCGDTLACIFKAPLKLILIILFLLLMAFIFCFRDLLVIIGMALVCIVAGLFGFSFELLSELDGGCFLLGILFFPVLMIIGIGCAFKEIFCDVIPDMCDEYCEVMRDGMNSIIEI